MWADVIMSDAVLRQLHCFQVFCAGSAGGYLSFESGSGMLSKCQSWALKFEWTYWMLMMSIRKGKNIWKHVAYQEASKIFPMADWGLTDDYLEALLEAYDGLWPQNPMKSVHISHVSFCFVTFNGDKESSNSSSGRAIELFGWCWM